MNATSKFPGVPRTLGGMLSKRLRPEFRLPPVTSTGTSTFTSIPPCLSPVEVEVELLPMEVEVEVEVFLKIRKSAMFQLFAYYDSRLV